MTVWLPVQGMTRLRIYHCLPRPLTGTAFTAVLALLFTAYSRVVAIGYNAVQVHGVLYLWLLKLRLARMVTGSNGSMGKGSLAQRNAYMLGLALCAHLSALYAYPTALGIMYCVLSCSALKLVEP